MQLAGPLTHPTCSSPVLRHLCEPISAELVPGRGRSVPPTGASCLQVRVTVVSAVHRSELSGHPASRWIALLGKHGCIPCEGRSGWHELPPNRRQHRQLGAEATYRMPSGLLAPSVRAGYLTEIRATGAADRTARPAADDHLAPLFAASGVEY